MGHLKLSNLTLAEALKINKETGRKFRKQGSERSFTSFSYGSFEYEEIVEWRYECERLYNESEVRKIIGETILDISKALPVKYRGNINVTECVDRAMDYLYSIAVETPDYEEYGT